MNNQLKSQVLDQLKNANNVLVTVSSNPTVDELAASVGLTLFLTKLGKHATTVFSGVVPSTIEFLQPEKTIETTTDSLRDFIIALDKSKADKLRYKVEDDVVRIFITPYRATITEQDLEFSHGDFNVDVVIALGITRRDDLDKAITAHGRILHDATVISLTKRDSVSELGVINWQEPQASSLCEMVAAVSYELQAAAVDGQMATAFLTGIIAETDRFKNEHTTPLALSLSSQLMSSGANQQLIAEKLEEPAPPPVPLNGAPQENVGVDGELAIDHDSEEADDPQIDNIHIDEHGNLNVANGEESLEAPELPPVPQDTEPETPEPYTGAGQDDQSGSALFEELASDGVTEENNDKESEPTLKDPETSTPLMTHGKVIMPPQDPTKPAKTDKPFDLQEALQASGAESPSVQPPAMPDEQVATPAQVQEPVASPIPEPVPMPPSAPPQPAGGDTLADLERSVDSPHVQAEPVSDDVLKAAQEAVDKAAAAVPPQFPPASPAIGAQPVDLQPQDNNDEKKADAPPPVPPPMMPQFYDADGNNNNPFLNPNQH